MSEVLEGDCVEVMAGFSECSVDAIVCDPPYGLTFMGKQWDRVGVAFRAETWREALRVAKPGAHLLAFGGTRTYHRLVCAIEDAGWEIRDCLVWAYASGFPKSLDVSKAIDKRAGHWRGKAGPVVVAEQPAKGAEYERTAKGDPVTAAAAGWGTALKPAWEPIVMARKPFRGSVAENWMEHGTGALNIDGTRIAMGPADAAAIDGMGGFGLPAAPRRTPATTVDFGQGTETRGAGAQAHDLGRWPANVILTDPIFDGVTEGVVGGGEAGGSGPASGPTWSGPSGSPSRSAMAGMGDRDPQFYGDSGTYSRFFLLPREEGKCRLCGVSIADASSSQLSEPDVSAPEPAPTAVSSVAATTMDSPITSDTATTSWLDDDGITPSIPRSKRRGISPASARMSNPAKSQDAASPETGTTTTTADRWMCAICVEATISRFISDSSERPRSPADGDDYPRFLLIPKADRAEREPVLGGHGLEPRVVDIAGQNTPEGRAGRGVTADYRPRANTHPTVKPVELMRHLIRLVTPSGGVVLDPFLGSGTTAIAAEMEGFGWIGIEKEPEYIAIARARLLGTQRGLGLVG